jgi:hypothetical protein
MKRISIILIAAFAGISFTGCLKDTPNSDFSKTGATAEILYSGLEYFSKNSPQSQSYALNFNADTLTYDIIVNINSDYPLNTDTKVTLAVDASALTAYNAANPLQYLQMPAGAYIFPVTSGTIKAGTRQLHFSLQFITAAFDTLTDPTQNYMLPITLKDAGGLTIASNFATIYPHSIGNVIAGAYTHEWQRWNGQVAPPTGAPTFDVTYGDILSPIDPATVAFYSNTGTEYIMTFTNNNAPGGKDLSLLTNFSVTFDAGSVSSAGITITAGPSVIADPVNHKYTFQFSYLNGSGAPRVIRDILTQ